MVKRRRVMVFASLAFACCLIIGAWGYCKWVDHVTTQVIDQAWSVAEGPANDYERAPASLGDFVPMQDRCETIKVVNIEKWFSFLLPGNGEILLRVTYRINPHNGEPYDQTHTIKLYLEKQNGVWVAVDSEKGY